jgi:hemoglobin
LCSCGEKFRGDGPAWHPAATIDHVDEIEVYTAIGEDGFRRLVGGFYRRIASDDLLGPMYPRNDLDGAERRLGDFLIFRFGGPPTYIERRGHPRLGMRHGRFLIDQAARDRWIKLMNEAFAEARLPIEAEQILRPFFEGTATFLINQRSA